MQHDDTQDDVELFELLKVLDHAPPRVTAASVVRRARLRRVSTRFAWAAGLGLSVALGGVAYAMPGSPVRAWIADIATALVGRDAPAPPVAVPTPEPVPESSAAGIAVVPGQSLLMVIDAGAATARLEVALTDEMLVSARATQGGASFVADEGRLTVRLRESSTVEILIPRTAARVEIRARGTRVFLTDLGRVTTAGVAMGSDRYLVALPGRDR